MNLKLLDLQTGKYLELGKDVLYGGDSIIVQNIKTFSAPSVINCALASFPPEDMDKLVTLNELDDSPEDKTLKTLCGKAGAVLYGDRYVLLHGFSVPKHNLYDKEHYFIGDIASVCVNSFNDADEYRLMILAKCQDTLLQWYEINTFRKQGIMCITSAIDTDYSDWFHNIFEEYSKKLCSEENQFDELFELLKF